MKKLESYEMHNIIGGDWPSFVDGACAGLSVGSGLGFIVKEGLKLTPQGRIAIGIAGVGCAAWGIYRLT